MILPNAIPLEHHLTVPKHQHAVQILRPAGGQQVIQSAG